MIARRLLLAVSLVFANAPHAAVWGAQPETAQQPPGAEEPVLPPVIVEPPVEPPDVVDDEPFEPRAAPQPTDPNDMPLAYPRLSNQFLGESDTTGLDSAIRGRASIFDTPSLVTIVDRELLLEKQAADMFQALQYEVGVLMQQTARGQASPFVRGLTGQQVLILIDGIRLNNATFRTGPNQYFNLIDPGMVDHIEIVRGPESVLWGSDAIGGVINVVTRSPSFRYGNYATGQFIEYANTADISSYSRANFDGRSGMGGVFGGASYFNVNDLDLGGDLGRQPFTGYHQYAGDVKYNMLLGSDALLTVALQHFEQQNLPRSDRFAPFVFGPPVNTPRPTFFDPQQRDLAYIRLQGLSDILLFDAYSTTVSYSRNREATLEIRSPTREDVSQFDVDSIGYNIVFARDFDWLGRLTYGGDYYNDQVGASRVRVDPTTGTVTPANPQFPNDSRYDRVGTFVNWEVDLTERLIANAGVRYENAGARGTLNEVVGTPIPFRRNYHDWITGVGLVYQLTPMWNVYGSYSEGFRAPNLDDLTSDNPVLQDARDVPSLDVEPETAHVYEVGMKFDFPRFRLQMAQYWVDLQNAILRQAVDAQGNPVPNVIGPFGTPIPGSSSFIRDNFDSYIYGTELAGEYVLGSGWAAYGNFWYTFGKDRDRNEPFSRIPPTQGVAGLRWRDGENRSYFDVFTWMVRRQDRYAAQNNIDSRFPVGATPGFATLNLRAGTTLGRCTNHRLSLGLENITDKAYRVLGSGVEGTGITATFGYDWTR